MFPLRETKPQHQRGAPRLADAADIDRAFKSINLAGSGITFDTMAFKGSLSKRRPLLTFGSLEFPVPPSVSFCEHLWQAGYQVIFIRRQGFGPTPTLPRTVLTKAGIRSGAATILEAGIIDRFIRQLKLENIVLLSVGTSNPLGYRLAQISNHISLSVFANPTFNNDIWNVFKPYWFREMIRQSSTNTGAFLLFSRSLKSHIRKNPLKIYQQILQKSAGDLDYAFSNSKDCMTAAHLFQTIETNVMFHDFYMSLHENIMLVDGYFEDVNAVALSGVETTPDWKTGLNTEAKRLGIPVAYAPRGDVFSAYASPDFLVDILTQHTETSAA